MAETNMRVICLDCGLPDELCVCDELGIRPNSSNPNSNSIIRLSLEKANNRELTIITGLTDKTIVSQLKKLCHCGGSRRNGVTILQGNHESKIRHFLHIPL